jgi:TPR repeat protein
LNGLGVEANENTAVTYFEQAAYRGHIEACVRLGKIFMNKAESVVSAVKWFHKASRRGNVESKLCLGQLFQCDVSPSLSFEANKRSFLKRKIDHCDDVKSSKR